MILTKIRNSLIAGVCGTSVHSLLALVHGKTGPLPEFQPNYDIQRGLSWLIGTEIHPGVAWLLGFVNGAVIWGFVFGQAYRFLPGNNPWHEGSLLWRLRLGCNGACILPARRSRHFRCQARVGNSPGNSPACDAARLQRDDESCLSSAEFLV